MESERYRVILNGELVSGRRREDVIDNLTRILEKRRSQVAKLVTGEPRELPGWFSRAEAKRLSDRMYTAGAKSVLLAEGESLKSKAEPRPKLQPDIQIETQTEAKPKPGRKKAGVRDRQSWRSYIGSNAEYYLPRFERFQRDGYGWSWNWIAFIFPFYWALYRKMWLWVVLLPILMLFPGLNLIIWIVLGASFNYLYYANAQAKIDFLSGQYQGKELERRLAAAGGVSLKALLIGIMLTVGSTLGLIAMSPEMGEPTPYTEPPVMEIPPPPEPPPGRVPWKN